MHLLELQDSSHTTYAFYSSITCTRNNSSRDSWKLSFIESEHLAHPITCALLGIFITRSKKPPTHHVIPKPSIIHAPHVKNAQDILV